MKTTTPILRRRPRIFASAQQPSPEDDEMKTRITKTRTRLVALAAGALVALGAGAGPAHAHHANGISCYGADTMPVRTSTGNNYATLRSAVLCLTNEIRHRNGRAPLVRSSLLESAAQRHSDDMVARRYCSHYSPEGVGPTTRYKSYIDFYAPGSWSIGENWYRGSDSGGSSTPRAALNWWMHSSGHAANILSTRFINLGVGVTDGQCGGYGIGGTYVQGFGYHD
jgi:uncharacterized protein YkwD